MVQTVSVRLQLLQSYRLRARLQRRYERSGPAVYGADQRRPKHTESQARVYFARPEHKRAREEEGQSNADGDANDRQTSEA